MLDFAKAFGIVEYSAMLSIMTHMGFPDQWLLWMRMIFHQEPLLSFLMEFLANSFIVKEDEARRPSIPLAFCSCS